MSDKNGTMKPISSAERLFAEEIEKLAQPLCEKVQSLPEDARKDFRAQDVLTHHDCSLRQDLLLKIFEYMSKSSKYKKDLDGVTCVEILDDSLQSYKAESYKGEVHQNEKLDFWRYFRNQYRRRISPWKYRPVEEVGLQDINRELRGQQVKEFLYLLAEKQGLAPEEIEALGLTEKHNRLYYTKAANALGILAKLGHDKDSQEAKAITDLLAQSNLHYYDQTVSQDDETANRYVIMDRTTYAHDMEEEASADSLQPVLERVFQVARKTRRFSEEQLKGYVTLRALATQDDASEGMRPYIIVPFFEAHRKKAYPPKITDTKLLIMRRDAMAEYLNLQPETWRKKMKDLENFMLEAYQPPTA